MNTYILDKNRKPVAELDMIEWGKWMTSANRKVDHTVISDVPPVHVSTVFLGIDHDFSDVETKHPLIFETMVFGGEFDTKMIRSRSWSDAEVCHKLMCEKIKTESKNDQDEKPDDPLMGTW